MDDHRIYAMSFASVYPHYVHKVEKKGRKKDELDEVICWLTGYSRAQLARVIATKVDFSTFFGEAPSLHPDAELVTGTVCGVRVEEVAHPLMRRIRILDKLVDELAKGRPMAKVLRQEEIPAKPGKSNAAKPGKRSAAKPGKRSAAKKGGKDPSAATPGKGATAKKSGKVRGAPKTRKPRA